MAGALAGASDTPASFTETYLVRRCNSGRLRPVKDYAGAWTAERRRCHRFVYAH